MSEPIFSKKYGALSVAIWENETRRGTKLYSVSFERSYRVQGEDGETEWKTQRINFNSDEMPVVSLVASQMGDTVDELKAQEARQSRNRSQDQSAERVPDRESEAKVEL